MEEKKGALGHALIGGCWNTEAGGRQAGGKVSKVTCLRKYIWLMLGYASQKGWLKKKWGSRHRSSPDHSQLIAIRG